MFNSLFGLGKKAPVFGGGGSGGGMAIPIAVGALGMSAEGSAKPRSSGQPINQMPYVTRDQIAVPPSAIPQQAAVPASSMPQFQPMAQRNPFVFQNYLQQAQAPGPQMQIAPLVQQNPNYGGIASLLMNRGMMP